MRQFQLLVVDSKLMSHFPFTVHLSFTCDFTNNFLYIQASQRIGTGAVPTKAMEVTTVDVEPATTVDKVAMDKEAATSRQEGQRNRLPKLKQRR